MSGRYLLDTNIAVEVLRGDRALWERLRKEREVLVNVVVLGELYFGAAKSARPGPNKERIADLASRMTILPCDEKTAVVYGEVKGRLTGKGRLIPANDVWIAASALQHGLTLLTRDAHFEVVEGLERESW